MSLSVLVPLDGSAVAEHALPVAIAAARRSGGTVHLCRVCEPEAGPRPLRAIAGLDVARRRLRAAAYLRTIAQRLTAAFGVRVRSAVRVGPPAESILREAELVGAELMVLTTHGRGGNGAHWIGSTADEIVHRADCAVLLLPGKNARVEWQHDGYARILVPVEAGFDPRSAVDGSCHLAALAGATYCLLPLSGANDPSTGVAREGGSGAPRELDLRSAEERIEQLGGRTAPAPVSGYPPAPAVMYAAREFGAGLIALSLPARLRGAPEAMSPLVERLVRMAPFPVLLHRPSVRRRLELPGLALPNADGTPRAETTP